jgi:hypothetical protein
MKKARVLSTHIVALLVILVSGVPSAGCGSAVEQVLTG